MPESVSVAPEPELFPEELAARYELVEELSTGTTGTLLRARAREGGDEVVVKRLAAGDDEAAWSRARAEVAALAELALPGLVRILDHGLDARGAWVVMEAVDGRPLDATDDADAAVGGGPGTVRCMEAVAGVLQGLQAAGRVHGDVRPGNVLVTAKGRVVLVGPCFGVDPRRVRPGEPEGPRGHFQFFSPQLWLRKRPSPESDWFAWSASFCWLVEGKLPIDVEALREGGIRQSLPRPGFFHVSGTGALAKLLRGMLAYVPQDRARHIEAVAEVLKEAEEIELPSAREPLERVLFPAPLKPKHPAGSARARTRPAAGRRWWLWVVLALSVAAALGWVYR